MLSQTRYLQQWCWMLVVSLGVCVIGSECGIADTTPQTPWQTNAYGNLRIGRRWNDAAGYHFTPLVNGQVTALGGYFDGTKVVRLFNKITGEVLATTIVTASNTWTYSSISPVNVQAGTTYTVAVYLVGAGASYRSLGARRLPQTFGAIRIDGSTRTSTFLNPAARPTNTIVTRMYGQADILFVPTVDTQPPQISAIGVTQITPTSAVITWTTDKFSTSQVDYGIDTNYGQTIPPDPTGLNPPFVTSHRIALANLSPFTTYHFRVRSSDALGNTAQSSDQTFRTAPPPTGTPRFDVGGIVFASFWVDEYVSAAAQQSLLKLAETGANYVGLTATWYMNTTPTDGEFSKSNVIYAHPQKSPSDAALEQVIDNIHQMGRKVFLKLHVRVILNNDPLGNWSDAWAGNIHPTDPAAWFASYTSFVQHYAALCQRKGVELVAFGTELPSMTTPANGAQWNSVIDAIRALYPSPGQLTFSSDFYLEYTQIPFWNRCDYLGIGPYFSLTSGNATNPGLNAILDGWTTSPVDGPIINNLAAWSAQYGNKPVLFTEIGYDSVDTATFQPWKGTQSLPENQLLQRRAYDALFLALQKQPWFAGMFWWDWLSDPDAGTVGLERRDYTPQNKPAQQSLTNFFLGIDPAKIASIIVADETGAEIADGSQTVIGGHTNLYAIARDAAGTSLGFVPATWSLTGSCATLTANDVGYARLSATCAGPLQVTARETLTATGYTDTVALTPGQRSLRVGPPPAPYQHIQDAANAAQAGDVVLVDPGTYPEAVSLPNGVSLVSASGPAVTIIDATGKTFGVQGGQLVKGFTIMNATGAGIARGDFNAGNTTKQIVNNIIRNNKGSGINIYQGAVTILNNVIRDNKTAEYGGGIRIDGGREADIINNILISNQSADGGGIYISSSPAVVFNNIIEQNTGTYGAGIRIYTVTPITEDYNELSLNTASSSGSDEFGQASGLHDLHAPCGIVDFPNGNYHLSAGSACINAGNPDSSYNDPNGTRNDLGVYGGPSSF